MSCICSTYYFYYLLLLHKSWQGTRIYFLSLASCIYVGTTVEVTSSPAIILRARRSLHAVHFHPHSAALLVTPEGVEVKGMLGSMPVGHDEILVIQEFITSQSRPKATCVTRLIQGY